MKALLILCSVFLFSCEVKVSSSGADGKKEKTYTRNDKKIRNGIELQTTGGVVVEQAFLTYADDGSLVSDENITELGRKMKLILICDGWKEEDGKVYIDASEHVASSSGETILSAASLFESNGIDHVSPQDAKQISLSVVINKVYKLTDHFLVQFKVWNKKADQSIDGRYKFHLDKM